MSDLSIPGVAGKIDTAKMIDALMEPDRVKVRRKEEEIEDLQTTRRVWQDLRGRISQLDDSARALYNFQNPFREKVATSSNSTVLTATATREAEREAHSFRVIQTAKADRFMSRPLPRDFRAPAGTYRIRVGEQEFSFSFSGGSLEELAQTIGSRTRGTVTARIVKNSESTRVFVIESQKEGAANALVLMDTAAEFAESAGIVERAGAPLAGPELAAARPRTPEAAGRIQVSAERLVIEPGGEAEIPFPANVPFGPEIVLEMTLEVELIPEQAYQRPSAPAGPEIPPSGGGEFQGHVVENEPSRPVLPPWTPPKPPQRIDDLAVVTAVSGQQRFSLPEIEDRTGEQTIRVPIGELTQTLDGLFFQNRNTHRRITVTDVRLLDPAARGGFRPANALSEAADAELEIDGITVTRSTNQIDDLLPGVNLTLLRESDERVTLEVDTDVDTAKDAVIEFVGFYNQLLTRIDILSRSDQQIVEDITYFSREERDEALEVLGVLQGDLTVNQMKNRLRQVTMQAYPTGGGSALSMLVQLGIATNTARPGTAVTIDPARLRGYLEIDEALLEQALRRNPEWVAQLFGNDTDGDFVVDTGVAFSVTENTRPYSQTGGLIAGRISTIEATATRRQRELDTMNRQLEEKESRLRRQYTMMEGMLNDLEQSSRALENFQQSQGANNR
jgi:flagellar hook-associated protein 2